MAKCDLFLNSFGVVWSSRIYETTSKHGLARCQIDDSKDKWPVCYESGCYITDKRYNCEFCN